MRSIRSFFFFLFTGIAILFLLMSVDAFLDAGIVFAIARGDDGVVQATLSFFAAWIAIGVILVVANYCYSNSQYFRSFIILAFSVVLSFFLIILYT